MRFVTLFILVALSLVAQPAAADQIPVSDPVAALKLPWTAELRWSDVVNVEDVPGETDDQRLAAAQAMLAPKGGGVVYFPAGTYRFADHILLEDGIILRGADPQNVTDARDPNYSPPTTFVFPRYQPSFEGEGTPNETAFKGIRLGNPETASNVGVVNIGLDHGHIAFAEGAERKVGRNRLVYGCVLRNAAQPAGDVPDKSIGQHGWQRFPRWHGGQAINVYSSENALVANNRIPESDASFVQPGYVIRGRGKRQNEAFVPPAGVTFDYDNRGGIAVNYHTLGGGGNSPPDGTPESHPWGFRKGTVIRDNYIYSTGRTAIAFSGDGTVCSFNVIRFKKDVICWTNTGRTEAGGSSTNDNRAATIRGWRWHVEGNDYEVYRNKASDTNYYVNDGEGLMHEDHANSTVVDSKLIGNRGNAYLCIYMTGGIDGLEVRENDIRIDRGNAIYVVASRVAGKGVPWTTFPCRNVSIVGNVTQGGIRIEGAPADNNTVRDNRNVADEPAVITNAAEAVLEGNEGYTVVTGTGRKTSKPPANQ